MSFSRRPTCLGHNSQCGDSRKTSPHQPDGQCGSRNDGARNSAEQRIRSWRSDTTHGRTFDSSRWFLDSASDIEEGVELADSLTRLLDRVEEARSGLWQLEGEGYWVNWLCFVGSHALEHNVDLDRELLRRLLACPGELWLDVYEAGPRTVWDSWHRRRSTHSTTPVFPEDIAAIAKLLPPEVVLVEELSRRMVIAARRYEFSASPVLQDRHHFGSNCSGHIPLGALPCRSHRSLERGFPPDRPDGP